MKRALLMLVLGALCVIAAFVNHINNEKYIVAPLDEQLEKIDYSKKQNLMIVAHPDDETIFGGMQLINEDYVVVCITGGVVKSRVEELTKAMKYSNDQFILLGHPDKTNGKRDNWDKCRDEIKNQLEQIINYFDWGKIVTHNPEGEYGHQHHIMTSNIVTSITTNKLYYFGRYYEKDDSRLNDKKELSADEKEKKDTMLKYYTSQKKVVDNLRHIAYHEEIVQIEDWG